MEHLTNNNTTQLNNDKYIHFSEMAPSEQKFLNDLILRFQPKKALEIGIAAGSSSVILLNALQNTANNNLISVDYATQYYRDSTKKSGFIVAEYPLLKEKWRLYTGGLVSNFIEEIGDNIDFCFIDTMHSMPGEVIDFLSVFPFLKENATVVLHDTSLHTWGEWPDAIATNLLASALSGEKVVLKDFDKIFFHHIMGKNIEVPFSNIAATILDKNQKERIWDIFNLLTQKWAYMPTPDDLNSFRSILENYYAPLYLEYFDNVVNYQKKLISNPVSTNNHTPTAKHNAIRLIWRYYKYKFLSGLLWGQKRERYKNKKNILRDKLKSLETV
jgi:predicted O-methyltransferase YrrM